MKKIFVFSVVLGALLLCGCSAKPEGYDSVKKAKELFEELDSARVIMEDISAGARLMEFSFYIIVSSRKASARLTFSIFLPPR